MLSLLLCAGQVQANSDTRRRAKAFFDRGETLYRLGEFSAALDKYQQALKLVRRPSIIFNIAQCHRQLGSHKRALFFYKLYLSDYERQNPGKAPPFRDEVNDHIQRLARSAGHKPPKSKPAAPKDRPADLGLVHLQGVPSGARVFVNGILVARAPLDVPIRLSPGRNRLEVVLAGARTWRRELQIDAGEEKQVLVELTMTRPRSKLWLGLGVAAAVLALGSEGLAIGYTAKANNTEYKKEPDAFDRYKSIAIGGHVGAGVLALGSVACFVLYAFSGGEVPAGSAGLGGAGRFVLAPAPLPGGALLGGTLRF